MDYKELIEFLKHCSTKNVHQNVMKDLCVDAATAIETLLVERAAIIRASRGNCALCVYSNKSFTQDPCISCRFGIGTWDMWQWRSPTPPNRERTEG